VGVDLTPPIEMPYGFTFVEMNVLELNEIPGNFDFIVASPPCEEFSVHGMKHFHPNPPYPELGIKLFNHTRALCEASGLPYVMENVRAAQQFIGRAVHHCGPFYLWGTGVPPILNQGIKKNWESKFRWVNGRFVGGGPGRQHWSTSKERKEATAKVATIPPELANCVADYAERLLEQQAKISLASAEEKE
jgi:hypothetical protein